MITADNIIKITTEKDLNLLINRFLNGPSLTFAFEFMTDEYFNTFLTSVGISLEEFSEKCYYYNKDKGIHISKSVDGYVWISTMGLVAKSKYTDNKYINSCCAQYLVLKHLFDDALSLLEKEDIYDINSYNNSMIELLTPALFYNTIFYFELLSKAYLSINGESVPQTHKLEKLLICVKKTLFHSNQNNSLFHAHAIATLEGIVKHISAIPGDFKEQFVKYDDNSEDTTLIDFHPDNLKRVRDIVEITHDMIVELYYDPKECFYFCSGLYERLRANCDSPEKRKQLETVYGFLKDTE